jgi:hypothetical protein
VLAVGDAEPPKEFRLFVSGVNETEKGPFLFDEEAATSVMDAYATWGVDLMIDLEHQALEGDVPPDPTARDARGWCNLELREDGSLWAVNVQWTEDGAERLKQKRQRYISPAFTFDVNTNRIMSLTNIALVAMPATRGTPALMSKRKPRDLRKLSSGPSFNDVRAAIDAALRLRFPYVEDSNSCGPCGPYVCDVFEKTVVYELNNDLFEVGYVFDGKSAVLGNDAVEVMRAYSPVAPAVPAPVVLPSALPASASASVAAPVVATLNITQGAALAAERSAMDPAIAQAAFDALLKGDAKACMKILKDLFMSQAVGIPSAEPADPDASSEDAPPPVGDGGADESAEPPLAIASIAAASARLMRLTAATDFLGAVEQVETWRPSARLSSLPSAGSSVRIWSALARLPRRCGRTRSPSRSSRTSPA